VSLSVPRIGLARGLALAWALAVVGVSVAAHGRPGWVEALAASPARVGEGKAWFLFSSAVLVDRPLAASLVSFLALAILAFVVCGARTFWWSAFLGQVVATLLVYVVIGAVRRLVADAFDSVMAAPDYGVSTISAAWLGSTAAVAWRRRGRSRVGKTSIAVSCLAVGLFAYSIRPDVTILSSEHIVAFVLGVACAAPRRWSRMLRAATSVRRLDATAATGIAVVLLVVAIAATPSALATLRAQIAVHLRPTVSRCARDWNRQTNAPRLRVVHRPVDAVAIAAARAPLAGTQRPVRWAEYCRYTFSGRRGTIFVLGRWQRGRVQSWRTIVEARGRAPVRADAALRADGRVHPLPHKSAHSPLVLTS
jgi:hypothetical protein